MKKKTKKTYSEEKVTNVVGNVDSQANVGKVETVAETDQGERDNVMADQLLEVLAGLLHAEHQHNGLLGPVRRLEQVVKLEVGLMRPVGRVFVHAAGVEEPDGGPRHDEHASRAEDAKVECRVHLLHESCLLGTRAEAEVAGERAQQLLHDQLARKGQNNDVEDDKGNVPETLAVLRRGAGRGVGRQRQAVGEEDEVVDRVGLVGRDGIAGQEGEDDGQGQRPGVAHGVLLNAARQ